MKQNYWLSCIVRTLKDILTKEVVGRPSSVRNDIQVKVEIVFIQKYLVLCYFVCAAEIPNVVSLYLDQ